MAEETTPTAATSASEPGLKRQLSQAVAWNAVFTPLKFVIDTAANLIKANLLLPAEIGALSVVSSAAASAGIWLDLGIEQTLPKFIPEAEHAGGRGAARRFLRQIISFKLLILLFAIVALPFWGGSLLRQMRAGAAQLADKYGLSAVGPLLEQLDRYGWVFLLTIAALIVLGALYDTLLAFLVSFFRQKAWNIINAFATLALPLLTVMAVLLGWGVIGVLVAMIITPVLSVLITWSHVRAISRERGGSAGEAAVPRDLWRRFVPYTAMGLLISGTEYFSSSQFVALFLGGDNLQAVAVFWIIYSFIKQVQGYVYTPLRGIQVPLFTRIRASNNQNLDRAWGTLMRLILVLVLPAAVGLSLLLRTLILIQFPAEYLQALGFGLVLIPFFFSEPFWGLGHNLLMVQEQYRPVMLSRLCALISIPLLIWLPPHVGLWGIAIAIGSSKMAAGLVVVSTAMRRYQLRFPWRFALKVALASLVMGLVVGGGVWLLGDLGTAASIAQRIVYCAACMALTLAGAITFVLLARLLKLIEPADRALLQELRNPMARRLIRLL